MKVKDLISGKKPVISFEFFPPKTDEGLTNLLETIRSLKSLTPSFVSMTYGAGGSTREKTIELVSRIKNEIGLETVAHLTCVGQSQSELSHLLTEFKKRGIENILALRGDPPKGETQFQSVPNGFRYASELVRFIKSNFDFCVGVAGYPEMHVESKNQEDDLNFLVNKVNQGADFIVTQLYFDNKDFYSFVEQLRKKGIQQPVIAGIMPITDFDQIKRFTTMCGAKIPAPLYAMLEKNQSNKEKIAEIGIQHAVAQCRDLLKSGVAGIHFYTLNKSHSTREIFSCLKKEGLVN